MRIGGFVARLNFNPLSPHGERRTATPALLGRHYFNPLSPHGERQYCQTDAYNRDRFQSTLPAWGETSPSTTRQDGWRFQSTLPAWGETDGIILKNPSRKIFQSTLPAWGETLGDIRPVGAVQISIHSPRMGRDPSDTLMATLSSYFNPLSPHGERHLINWMGITAQKFQSTLPAWGETCPARRSLSR